MFYVKHINNNSLVMSIKLIDFREYHLIQLVSSLIMMQLYRYFYKRIYLLLLQF